MRGILVVGTDIDWQLVTVMLIALAALVYLISRARKKLKQESCASSGCSCPGKKLAEKMPVPRAKF